ncbi:hypothetical protein FH972_020641 [Carpinus fangiana]|uniref:Calcineurin-like phosphoesterase domain-containing protein n=1 Tax=Carpinus fangiana TaxID=176857 RepID=A0A5N6RU94_9ROSI|nr:hypothetical protein FH972_020641 [Carpinus fangiana]
MERIQVLVKGPLSTQETNSFSSLYQRSNRFIWLQNHDANWKIVVGHHTVRSIGHHGDTMELVMQLLPILESVDMYINGYDHCLEHLNQPNLYT